MRRDDPYRDSSKLKEPAQCPVCSAIVKDGRWVRPAPQRGRAVGRRIRPRELLAPHMRGGKTLYARRRAPYSTQQTAPEPENPKEVVCPACRQQKDGYAQGVVELHGGSWLKNEDDVLRMIRRTEGILRTRNDQERIISVRDVRDVRKVYVTLPELARQIGRELAKAYKGKVRYHHSRDDVYLRVVWDSDEGVAKAKERPSVSRTRRRRGAA